MIKESKLVIGLMSGTSLDGVDAALVEITGSGDLTEVRHKEFVSIPFDPLIQSELLRVASGRSVPCQVVSHLNFLLATLYSEAVLKICRQAQVELSRIDLIGSHGQTIFHQSDAEEFCGREVASTLQIGEGSILAENTGVTTVFDFRPRDMAAGGKGAPLIPYVDYLLFRNQRLGRVLLNVGGIANVTLLPAGAQLPDVKAFDTGPGNMVMDALVRRFTHGTRKFDEGGVIAAKGKVETALLTTLLSHPYFESSPPKTAGREQFGERFTSQLLESEDFTEFEDLLCTATELTAQSIQKAILRFVVPVAHVDQMIVSGGGARNDFLMQRIRKLLPQIEVIRSDDLGVPSAAKEAIGFAILANETLHLHPGNVPSATGASHPVVLGKVVYGENYQRLRGFK